MNPNSKCVYKGEEFAVYTWEETTPNGEVKKFERLQARDATTVISALPDEKLIILKEYQSDGSYYITFPGGRVESNETPEECSKRELIEETGYTSDDIFLWNQYSPYQRVERHIHILVAKNCYKIQEQKLEPDENIEVIIIDFDKLFDFVNNEYFRNRILLIELLRMELNPSKKAEFKKLLFG